MIYYNPDTHVMDWSALVRDAHRAAEMIEAGHAPEAREILAEIIWMIDLWREQNDESLPNFCLNCGAKMMKEDNT